MRPEQHDSQQQRWMPKDKKAIPSKLPREIIFTLEFYSHPNYQSSMKRAFSYFQECKISKKSPPPNPLDSYLKIQVFCSVKINKQTKSEDPD